MELKYLQDGRKVAVIGKLNNDETIVQEIFVTQGGDEIPSGERFVVKSLHDQPVMSYKDKQAAKAESMLSSIERRIKEANRDYASAEERLKAIREMVKSSQRFVDLLPEADLDVFAGFVTGSIEWLVVDDYRVTPPVRVMDKIIQFDSYNGNRFEGIKLMSVMGKSGGDINYRISRYSDGSGDGLNVYPFSNYADAIAHIKHRAQEKIGKGGTVSPEDFKLYTDMGVAFDSEYIDMIKAGWEKSIQNFEANAEKTRLEQQKSIERFTNAITALG